MSNALEARAWVEVDTGALRENYRTVRRTVGERPAVIPMVKADGYGLGMTTVVRAFEQLAPWGYGVATADEGAALRASGVRRPILVVGPLTPEALARAAAAGLIASISDVASLAHWAALAEKSGPLEFHVEIDTGMGRAGFDWRETSQWAERARASTSARLQWTGAFTHFHGADAADATPSITQWQRFQDALAQLPVSREDLMVHACNSAAALRWPEFAGDAVRPGIFLYGGHPAPDAAGVPAPHAVAAVRARLVLVREVPPGSTVGYGATHVAREWERWGTVSIGYGDGLPRALGNHGRALVRGREVPIVGRISMDMLVVELSAAPEVEVGDVITLIGRDGACEISVGEVAAQAGTISYEVLTGFTQRLPRVER
jgi:alanine racemase